MTKTRKMTMVTMLIAIAIVFHLVESMIPIPVPIPGFKLGLANIVGLIALYLFGFETMLVVNIMRVILASLMRGIIFGTPFWLSLSGVLLSSLAAYFAYKYTKLSIYGVSMMSAAFHAIGQMIVVMIIYNQALMSAFLPVLLILSVPTGIFTGYIAKLVLVRLKWKESK